MRVIVLFGALTICQGANFELQNSYLLAVGARHVTIVNTGSLGGSITKSLYCPGSDRVRYTLNPIFVPPLSGTTYTDIADYGTISLNRQDGIQYEWIECVNSSGTPYNPRKITPNTSIYQRANSCDGSMVDTLPQVIPPVITTNPMPMPIEVISHGDCYVQGYQFNLVSGHASSNQRLLFNVYNPSYNTSIKSDGKISFKVNNGAWLNLTNASITCVDESRFFGPVGSFRTVRECSLPIADGTITSGNTTVVIYFRFNGTDGISSGAYIRAVNIVEANRTISSIAVTTNSAQLSDNTTPYNNGDTVWIQNAPSYYMRFNGIRTITAKAANTFNVSACGTDTPGCTSPDGTYAPPVDTSPVASTITAQITMYSAKCAIAASSFTQVDRTAFTAPVGGVAATGKNYFQTGNSAGTPNLTNQLVVAGFGFTGYQFKYAQCNSCHAYDGRDLQDFGFSDNSIIKRTEFHGFSEQTGKNIAAYIRSLTATTTNGKPWNPPFQPCPGQSSGSTVQLFVGGGIDCVTLTGYQDVREFMHVDTTKFLFGSRLEQRDIPIPFPLADIEKGWWPTCFPADCLPNSNFLTSSIYLNYVDLMANMTAGNFTSFAAHNYGRDQSTRHYADWVDSLANSITHNSQQAGYFHPSAYPLARQSVAQYAMMRFYDIFVVKDMFKFGGKTEKDLHGGNETPTPNFPLVNGTADGAMFNSPAHKFDYKSVLNCSACTWGGRPNAATEVDQSNAWYYADPIKGGGNGWDSPDSPVDMAYSGAFSLGANKLRPNGYMTFLWNQVVVPQQGQLQTDFYFHNGNGSPGTDIHALWNQVINYDKRYSYMWFTDAQISEYADNWADMALSIINSRSVGYWNTQNTNSNDLAPNAAHAFDQSSGGIGDMTAYMIPMLRVMQATDSKVQAIRDWAKSLTTWNSYNWDNAYASGAEGDAANSASANLTTPGSNTITYTADCPDSVSNLQNLSITMPIVIHGGSGADEMVRPTGGTCAAVNGSGTLVVTTVNVHASSGNEIRYGCRANRRWYNWNGNGTPPFFKCRYMF